MTTMRHAAFLLLVGNILLSTTHALNVAIRGVSCDESLQVAVVRNSLNMTCASTRGCTFGDTVLIQGQLIYQGVNKLQLNYNSTAYMVGELDVTVDVIEIPEGTTLGLCGSDSVWITASETLSECPDSGIYNFEVTLHIPEYENDWWASGWHTGGEISLYTDADYSWLIGYCEVHIVTQVTSDRFLHMPSAFTTVFLVAGLILVGATWACYFVLCVYMPRRKMKRKDDEANDKYHHFEEKGDILKDTASGKSSKTSSTEASNSSKDMDKDAHEKVPMESPHTCTPLPEFQDLSQNKDVEDSSLEKESDSERSKKSIGAWLSQTVNDEGAQSSKHGPAERESKESAQSRDRHSVDLDHSDSPESGSNDKHRKVAKRVDQARTLRPGVPSTKRWRFRVIDPQLRNEMKARREHCSSARNAEPSGSHNESSQSSNVAELVKKLSHDSSSSSSTSVPLSSSSSSSSSSGFVPFSSIQKAETGAFDSPGPYWNTLVSTVQRTRSANDAASSSSSSCDALSYVETNQAPTGQVQGLIQYAGWTDTDTASMPAPSSAVSKEKATLDLHATEKLRRLKGIQSKAVSMVQSVRNIAQTQEDTESFFKEKPSPIKWEKTTLTTGYHRFDV